MTIDDKPFNLLISEADNLKQICQPLSLLGITNFFFMRLYNDGTFCDLSTEADWSVHFLNNFYMSKYEVSDIQHHLYYFDHAYLWEHNPHNKIWQEGKETFSSGNGISIFKNNNDYNEVFSFYSTKSNYEINNFYINHLDVLEKFIDYFNERAAHLIEKAEKNRFIIPAKYQTPPDHLKEIQASVSNFLSGIGHNNLRLGKKYDYQQITPRELECLSWLFKGKSADEIGLILGCSKRTVEVHISSMKTKFNCNKTASLIYTATKLGLDSLFEK